MSRFPVINYLEVTSTNFGAIAIFNLYGDEHDLVRHIDARIGAKNFFRMANELTDRELRYGWLRDGRDRVVDEVMVGKPLPGFRVLMTHGGTAVRAALLGYFQDIDVKPIDLTTEAGRALAAQDALLATMAQTCLTEAQAGAVLECLASGKAPPPSLMAVHRVVLVGAPNAGKSSLLNCLAGYDRAFVDPEAGATRDAVDEMVDIGGYAVWLGDLPGLQDEADALGQIARERALDRLGLAEMIWLVVDQATAWDPEPARTLLARGVSVASVGVILNKADLPRRIEGEPWRQFFPDAPLVSVSSLADGGARQALARFVHGIWGSA